jgi:hypothetical protein
MRIDDTVLYEEFVRARQEAVKLTDRYREAPADAQERDLLWERVVRQTETARLLLVSWLREVEPPVEEREPLRELLIANR